MSQITCSGRGPDRASTMSHVPSGWSRTIASTSERARARTYSSTWAMTRGVKAFCTIERSRKWRGSSSTIIEPNNSVISSGVSPTTMLGHELKVCGCRLTCQTSS